jgi:hypothetical protein
MVNSNAGNCCCNGNFWNIRTNGWNQIANITTATMTTIIVSLNFLSANLDGA